MSIENIENYYKSMSPIISMRKACIIDDSDYDKAEALMAKKYCIKKGNILRLIDWISCSERAIIVLRNNGEKHGPENNENPKVTEVKKED